MFVFIEGNESIAYGNLPQSPLDMDKLPPKGFWKQQAHTLETGAAAYNAAGTGCGEAKQVLTIETIGLQVDVQLHFSIQAKKQTGEVYLYRAVVCAE